MEKILLISLKLNFTPNTLCCYELRGILSILVLLASLERAFSQKEHLKFRV